MSRTHERVRSDTRDHPAFWRNAHAFLKYTTLLIFTGSATFLAAILAFVPDQIYRALGPVATALLGLISWQLLARKHILAAMYVLTCGFWLIATVIAVFHGGMTNMAIMYYPLLILIAGWMAGTRAAVMLAVLSAAATLGFALADSYGVLPAPPFTPPAMRWLIQSLVYLFSVVVIVYFVRSYQSRLDEVHQLDRDLNRAQAVAHTGSWVYDIVRDRMSLSSETCRIFGLPEGTVGNRETYLARVHPEDRARVDAAWKAAIATRQQFDDEHRIVVRAGVRWVRQIAEFEFGADGAALRSVGTTQDMTAARQADAALRESEERFRTLLLDIPNVAVQGYALDGTTQYWNRASERLYGYGAEEAIGKSLLELIIPSEMHDGVRGAIAQMAATGEAIPAGELSLQRKDGTRVPVFSSHALMRQSGRDPELFCIDIDLTEQKRQEAEILAARNQLAATLDAIPDLLFEMGLDGRYHDFHTPNSGLLAAPPDRLLGRTVSDVMPPGAAEICMAALREAHETGHSHGKQFELELAQGRLWFETSVARKPVDAGEEPRFIALSRDITERKLAAEALRASEERFRRLAENAPDLIYRYDFLPVRGFAYVSPAATAITGYTPEEHYADPDLGKKLIHPDDRHLLDDISADAMQSGIPIELRWLKKDGSVIWTEQRNLPILDADGRMIAIEGMARDITERKRKEDEYRTIIQASIDAFWITDFSGHILDVNDAATRMLGYSRAELVGMPIGEIDADESALDIAARTRDMILTGNARFQSRHKRKDGRLIHVEVSVMHVAALGERLFAFVRDITERKAAEAARTEVEAQLRESQKMEALGTLAGGIAHDFNNIVATIIGNAELARQDVGPAHAALESLEEIRKASRRARDLVQQILAFGRRQLLARTVIPLAPVIDESVRLLRSTLPAGIALRVDCAADTPQVLADATQVEQVLLNLCSNAWQAMQTRAQGGLIEVRLTRHVVGGLPYHGPERRRRGERVSLRPGPYACLAVRDNGQGMDPATRSRIFEPFFTTKAPGEGTGLGLAVVHGILRDHEASIVVQSAPGEGATFRIYFPAAGSDEVDAAATASTDPHATPAAAPRAQAANAGGAQALVLQGEGRHILYLDDDEAIVFLMTRLLQRQGYRVSGYTDAREALAAVRAAPSAFDLVVTDYNMPGMSGLDVARALQEMHPALPVALASGYITEELRAKAPAAGVRELIYKPDTAEDLCQAVARLVSTLPA